MAPPALPPLELPLLTADLPGTGGRIRSLDDDFGVEELPAYEPSGDGDHVWVWIEKRGVTTPVAAARIAAAAGVPVRDVGWAGLKDRHAVTRQWLSLPPPAKPEQVAGFDDGGVRVVTVTRHRNKLRTGHLRGNRFVLIVRGVGDAEVAAARARAVLAALAEAPGAPNWYGEQRFGRDGDNAEAGLAVLRDPRGRTGGPPRQRRFLVSALQSYLFNRWLAARVADGLYRDVVTGDILQKRATGGIFMSTEPEVDRARLAAGELVVTGPMFGAAMRAPPDGTPAHRREAAILATFDLGPQSFHAARAIAQGTRRAASIAIGEPEAVPAGPDVIRVGFSLPAGAYATAVLREIQKGTPYPEPDVPGNTRDDPDPTDDPDQPPTE